MDRHAGRSPPPHTHTQTHPNLVIVLNEKKGGKVTNGNCSSSTCVCRRFVCAGRGRGRGRETLHLSFFTLNKKISLSSPQAMSNANLKKKKKERKKQVSQSLVKEKKPLSHTPPERRSSRCSRRRHLPRNVGRAVRFSWYLLLLYPPSLFSRPSVSIGAYQVSTAAFSPSAYRKGSSAFTLSFPHHFLTHPPTPHTSGDRGGTFLLSP